MRSSAIAEELVNRGEDVIFVGQISELPWVEERIACLGFKQIHNESQEFISNPASDILILDSYNIDINEEFINSKNWLHIVAIVDASTPNYSCTIRVHPGLDSGWVGKSKIPTLAGPKFVPIRSSLMKNVHNSNRIKNCLRIAVIAGGSDTYELVPEIAKILGKMSNDFEVYLFSRSDADLALDSRFHFIQIGQQFDELTRDIDLVLTTASTSSLEFLARGICVGLVCAVDNQQQYYDSLGQLGVAAQLGFRTLDNKWILDDQKICSLITSDEMREGLKRKATGLIDFNGASRIVDAITAL
jgi:spore coat polysaccharide biosynthesis predicted glycosyltransferase SpsG